MFPGCAQLGGALVTSAAQSGQRSGGPVGWQRTVTSEELARLRRSIREDCQRRVFVATGYTWEELLTPLLKSARAHRNAFLEAARASGEAFAVEDAPELADVARDGAHYLDRDTGELRHFGVMMPEDYANDPASYLDRLAGGEVRNRMAGAKEAAILSIAAGNWPELFDMRSEDVEPLDVIRAEADAIRKRRRRWNSKRLARRGSARHK